MLRLSLIKRDPLPRWVLALIPIMAVVATLLVTAIPILLVGGDIWKSYYHLFNGALGTRYNFLETLVKASPLILTGLAVAFAFRAKFWNIGAEGQLLCGAITAAYIGAFLTELPDFAYLPLMITFGFMAGGLWACIPALLKTRLKVDDVVSTLLLNYVMLHIMGALLFGPLQQSGSSWPRSPGIVTAAKFPVLMARSRLHIGFIIALVAVLIIWFINKKTVFGYQAKTVGVNIKAANYGGINTTTVLIKTALISGGLAGLAGVGEVCGIQYALLMDISPGYGYTGIVIAMLGNLHPIGVALAAFFFSIINVGAQTMSRMTDIPTYIVGVMEGTALIVMLIFLLLTEYRVKWAGR